MSTQSGAGTLYVKGRPYKVTYTVDSSGKGSMRAEIASALQNASEASECELTLKVESPDDGSSQFTVSRAIS